MLELPPPSQSAQDNPQTWKEIIKHVNQFIPQKTSKLAIAFCCSANAYNAIAQKFSSGTENIEQSKHGLPDYLVSYATLAPEVIAVPQIQWEEKQIDAIVFYDREILDYFLSRFLKGNLTDTRWSMHVGQVMIGINRVEQGFNIIGSKREYKSSEIMHLDGHLI